MNIDISTFKVIKEAGTNGAVIMSGTALLLPDTGDKVEFALAAAVAGKYRIVTKVRLGDRSKNNNMAAAYRLSIDDKIYLPTVGIPGALETRFGGSYWGTLTIEASLSAGAHKLSVESLAGYTGIDSPIEFTLVEAAAPEMILKSTYDQLNSNYMALLGNFNSLKSDSEKLQSKIATITNNYTVLRSSLSVDEVTAIDKLQKILTSIKAIDSLIS